MFRHTWHYQVRRNSGELLCLPRLHSVPRPCVLSVACADVTLLYTQLVLSLWDILIINSENQWRFIAVFTRALHCSTSWARSIHSIPSHPISLRSILILSMHLRLCLPRSFLGFLRISYIHCAPCAATYLAHLILVRPTIFTCSSLWRRMGEWE
jgi:hypothetical protein